MKAPVAHAVAFVAALSLGACRQADGPVPTPDDATQEELADVTRDLQNVASRNPQAPEELADDLRKYAQEKMDARPAVDELSRRTAEALAGVTLDEQIARQLTHNLWMSVAADELSERQVEGLQNDVRTLLMSTGVGEEPAQQVAVQVGEVQRAVTGRPRRWYELF